MSIKINTKTYKRYIMNGEEIIEIILYFDLDYE